jgi:hypothetical protein
MTTLNIEKYKSKTGDKGQETGEKSLLSLVSCPLSSHKKVYQQTQQANTRGELCA